MTMARSSSLSRESTSARRANIGEQLQHLGTSARGDHDLDAAAAAAVWTAFGVAVGDETIDDP
ncbi:hypothetical protein GCM10009810_14660 [Nostocoides vanveenii]|uniref:Uncharacterized protein n=1 Tax=Nostocoides vanveenii TaxID=330835 RepID=A0ABP4WJF7_9MICO